MTRSMKGYRAFPQYVDHPLKAKTFTEQEFHHFRKIKMQEAPPICEGHGGTTVWYVEKFGYIIEIKFKSRPNSYIFSIATFSPDPGIGMDRIDGEFV